jgi:hypothetical protein
MTLTDSRYKIRESTILRVSDDRGEENEEQRRTGEELSQRTPSIGTQHVE